MNPDLEMHLLRSFLAVAETGSFTLAASRLHVVQSAVSMQVRRLEELLGQPVFLRSSRPIRLTPAGTALLGYARRILRLNEQAVSDLRLPVIEGSVRLGTVDVYATYFLPDMLRAFARAYPRVALEVRCDNSWVLMDALRAGELDLVVATRQVGFAGGTVLLREPLAWVTGRDDTVHEQEPLPLALLAHDCACRNADIGVRIFFPPSTYLCRTLGCLLEAMPGHWMLTWTFARTFVGTLA